MQVLLRRLCGVIFCLVSVSDKVELASDELGRMNGELKRTENRGKKEGFKTLAARHHRLILESKFTVLLPR